MQPLHDPADLPTADESMSLASRARGGDGAALEELLARHEPWLRRVAHVELGARLRRRVDSMDLVQEVGLIALKRIGDLRVTSASSVRRWLRSILGYHIRDLLKAMNAGMRDMDRERPLDVPHAGEATDAGAFEPSASDTLPADRAAKAEAREILDEIVGELSDDHRAVVLLRDYDHAEWEEIREALGRKTTDAVRQLYNRAWVQITSKAGARMGRG